MKKELVELPMVAMLLFMKWGRICMSANSDVLAKICVTFSGIMDNIM